MRLRESARLGPTSMVWRASPRPGWKTDYGVTRRRQFLEVEAPVLVGESRRGERMSGAEQRDRRVSFRADAARELVQNLRGCGGRDENQKPKAQHGNSIVAPRAASV